MKTKSLALILSALLLTTGCQALNNIGQKQGAAAEESVQTPTGFAGFSDIPVPNGAKMNLDSSLVFGSGDDWTGRLVKSVSINASESYDFYITQMPNYGWTKITSVRSDVSILTFVRGDRIATITVEPRSLSGTHVVMTVSPREYGSSTSSSR